MKTVRAKVVVLGTQGVGKTSLVTRYESGKFSSNTSSTIGASFTNLEVITDNAKIKMQIWDTAGQERFRSMAPMYYRGSNAAILVYDITNYDTFTDIYSWVNELRKRVDPDLLLVVVGNKSDLSEKRAVKQETAEEYAQSISASFFETSAITNDGVESTFKSIAERISEKLDNEEDLEQSDHNTSAISNKSTVSLNDSAFPQERQSRCCS